MTTEEKVKEPQGSVSVEAITDKNEKKIWIILALCVSLCYGSANVAYGIEISQMGFWAPAFTGIPALIIFLLLKL
jgi:hypothetical protein